jgi:hypothetical protein
MRVCLAALFAGDPFAIAQGDNNSSEHLWPYDHTTNYYTICTKAPPVKSAKKA